MIDKRGHTRSISKIGQLAPTPILSPKRRFEIADSVIVFLKAPIPGKVKTRLARTVGDNVALTLYRCFVADILDRLDTTGHPVRLYFYPSTEENAVRTWLPDRTDLYPQHGRTLGEKMHNALTETFETGVSKAVLIGTDVPDLPASIIDEAFERLDLHPAVMGPSPDGGYYLIGFNADTYVPEVFQNIDWGTDRVFSLTGERFQKMDISPYILPGWRDIDTAKDLDEFIRLCGRTLEDAPHTLRYIYDSHLADKIKK